MLRHISREENEGRLVGNSHVKSFDVNDDDQVSKLFNEMILIVLDDIRQDVSCHR